MEVLNPNGAGGGLLRQYLIITTSPDALTPYVTRPSAALLLNMQD